MEDNKYPESEKLIKCSEQSQLCGEFLEWLQAKYFLISKKEKHESPFIPLGYSSFINIEKLLAEFFGIDLSAVEEERQRMLAELNSK